MKVAEDQEAAGLFLVDDDVAAHGVDAAPRSGSVGATELRKGAQQRRLVLASRFPRTRIAAFGSSRAM
jgi:hypothetical protein